MNIQDHEGQPDQGPSSGQPNPPLARRSLADHTHLDGALLPSAGRWRSVETHAWLVLRSGHGLASEVRSLGPALAGSVTVHPEAERSTLRVDFDLRRLVAECAACREARPPRRATLTLEAARVSPLTKHGWALSGTLGNHATTTPVEAHLDVRAVHVKAGVATQARFTVRTLAPIAALGLCGTHRLGSAATGSAELLTHLLTTPDPAA